MESNTDRGCGTVDQGGCGHDGLDVRHAGTYGERGKRNVAHGVNNARYSLNRDCQKGNNGQGTYQLTIYCTHF